MPQRYLIALGANMRHPRHGSPEQVLEAALVALGAAGALEVEARSPIIRSAPLGPSARRYANAAAVVRCRLAPPELLSRLKRVEATFGRRRAGRRWRARVLDLDIILWSGGAWCGRGLTIPHTQFRRRAFVLRPAAAIAASWRDPLSGLTIRHLLARLTKPHPVPRGRPLVGPLAQSVEQLTFNQ